MKYLFDFVAIACQVPANGVNTIEVDESRNYVYNDEHKYECSIGYTTLDDLDSRCQANGTWSISTPTCYGDATAVG